MSTAHSFPAISIVTLSYNQGRFLQGCLASVLDQEGARVEYIVVDPGSTDGSRKIIDRHADRIQRILREPDDGPADGLNKGFAGATGGIFGYINADDRLSPGALKFVARYFSDHPEVDVLCGAIRIIDAEGRVSLRRRTADRFDLRRYAAGVCTIGQQATFFRRTAFSRAGGFNRNNRIAWDGELLVDLALSGARFETTSRVLGDFRIYGDSITGSANYRDRLNEYRRQIEEKLEANDIELYSALSAAMLRLAYKADLLRHFRYILAR